MYLLRSRTKPIPLLGKAALRIRLQVSTLTLSRKDVMHSLFQVLIQFRGSGPVASSRLR
jgi:hypothetical protein